MWQLQVLSGLVLLAAGGEALVRGSSRLAARLGLSPLLIGIVLIGFGTSAPELVTSVTAALEGSPGIAVGNVVGSNITNLLLVLGVTAILSPLAIQRRSFRRDGIAVGAATALLFVLLIASETIGRWAGVAGLLLLAAYLVIVTRGENHHSTTLQAEEPEDRRLVIHLVMLLVGLAAVVYGADLLVGGASTLARSIGVSEAVIGLSVVAIGTSLPELAAAVAAALRKKPELAIGNILGSCIFNILGILGVTALLHPLAVPREIAAIDAWVLLVATGTTGAFLITGWRLTRREGVILLAAFTIYLATLALPWVRASTG